MNAASFAFKTTKEDIEGLRYLNCPRKAAVYLGIPEVWVQDVWAEMPEPRQRANDLISDRESSGNSAYSDFKHDAFIGSERLRDCMIRSMYRWADSNGTTLDEAARFLMSGTR